MVRRAMYRGKPCLEQDQCAVTEEEAIFLSSLAIAIRPTCIAEVGTGRRRSLSAFMRASVWLKDVLDFSCAVWSCDISGWPILKAKEEFPDAHMVHGDSSALVKRITISPQLIFIDGDHSYQAVREDYDAFQMVATPDATYVFHDVLINEEVMRFVSELGGLILDTPRGIGMVRS